MIQHLKEKIIQGYEAQPEEIYQLAAATATEDLCEAAHEITQAKASRQFDLCSIINAKSGKCSENCKWCAQSAHFQTNCDTYGLVDTDTLLTHCRHNESQGVHRFSLVTSGRRPSEKETEELCSHIRLLHQQSRMQLCASLGLASREQLEKLYQAGIRRYHCNLETAPSYFSQLCTTHTQEEKIRTIRAARDCGMEICSGGIIGMGETETQRIELAFTLRELHIQSIPLNVLHPIPGTPLARQPLLTDDAFLRCIALFRLIHPTAFLRLAGGRARFSQETLDKALYTGINAAIVGDLLTTLGSRVEEDKQRFKQAGYEL